ncbi:hypothetical protein F4604DRAFT_1917999 [Suillus subluteus]|nr:hypothetical protein F4604DRAFT_1917999 [Suillus subluteus]
MPLIAHVYDLPEKILAMGYSTPLYQEAYTATPRQYCQKNIDPWDLDKFQKAAKALNLSGVHMPYWCDWIYACPSVFLRGEILHTCFKFFTDHPLKWVKESVGAYELDTCFIIQHNQVGTCHFMKGIMHVKQMMGHGYRDIECTIVASIAGAISPRFICAIRGLIDFIHLTQNPVHSPQSLQAMTQALLDFHSFKDASVTAEARKGKNSIKEDFFIPR